MCILWNMGQSLWLNNLRGEIKKKKQNKKINQALVEVLTVHVHTLRNPKWMLCHFMGSFSWHVTLRKDTINDNALIWHSLELCPVSNSGLLKNGVNPVERMISISDQRTGTPFSRFSSATRCLLHRACCILRSSCHFFQLVVNELHPWYGAMTNSPSYLSKQQQPFFFYKVSHN